MSRIRPCVLTHMLRTRTHSHRVSQCAVNAWNSLSSFYLPWSLNGSRGFEDASDTSMSKQLDGLRNPGRKNSPSLHCGEIRLTKGSLQERHCQQIGRRDAVLNGEVNPHATRG